MGRYADVVLNGPGDAWWHDEAGAPVARPSRADQLWSLVEVLDRGVEAGSSAEQVVAACLEPVGLATALAREGARIQVAFYRLQLQLDELDLDREFEDARERSLSLLLEQQSTLRAVLATVFSPDVSDRSVLRGRIHGLGAAATTLRELRNQLWADAKVMGWSPQR